MSQPVEAFRNALRIPELKHRIVFTLVLLAVYRIGVNVPTPGIDGAALAQAIGGSGSLLGFYNLFSGGALEQASIFSLGIMPYITVSIILSLLVAVVPSLEKLAKEGAEGQKKINEYTRYGTVLLGIIQSFSVAVVLQRMNTGDNIIVANPNLGYYLMCMVTFTTGAIFIMWLGEQISEHGIGNGISLIIFVSIISRLPGALATLLDLVRQGSLDIFRLLILAALMVVVIAGVIMVTTGQRRVSIQYPRQVKGRRVSAGGRNYLPLRVNQAGVIPIIFASSLLMLPTTIASALHIPALQGVIDLFRHGTWLYNVFYAGLIIFFTYFYTAVTFNPIEIADNLKKYGGVVMGVRPGKATAEYLNRVMTRITLVGAFFLAAVALLPELVFSFMEVYDWRVASFFGGTSLLILVGVALDTVRQVETHLVMRNYEGFMKGRRIRGRRA